VKFETAKAVWVDPSEGETSEQRLYPQPLSCEGYATEMFGVQLTGLAAKKPLIAAGLGIFCS
jgi:hypothetical protein